MRRHTSVSELNFLVDRLRLQAADVGRSNNVERLSSSGIVDAMQETPERAGQITTREELIFALSRAAELEHGLTCIYLFAAFSMKRFTHEGIDEIQQDQIRNWEGQILAVAKQEMEHLGIVCNLLNAIGAPQHFDRPNLPQSPSYYSTQGAFTLEPFSIKTVKRFMEFEKPATSSFAGGVVEGDQLVPGDILTTDFHTVQELYETILQGFVNLNATSDLFIGPPEAQVDDTDIVVGFADREYGIDMVEVTDLETARQAIDVIIEQGEGITLDEAPPRENARRLQNCYQNIAAQLKAVQELKFHSTNWQHNAEELSEIITQLLPVLEITRVILTDEVSYLETQYTDPAWPASLPDRMAVASATLAELNDQIQQVLDTEHPEPPVDQMRVLKERVVEVTEYDVEGIVLSGYIEPDSHYLVFWQIYEQLKEIEYEPARNVAQNPALRLHPDNKEHAERVTIATYGYSRQVMELFNACYETMVQMLILTFSYNRISPDKRTLLFHTAFFPFMSMVIRPVSELLTLLPVHERKPGEDWAGGLCAGSPYEYYLDIGFLPNREAGWTYLNERLSQIATFSDQLTDPPAELVDFMGQESLNYFMQQINFLQTNLVRIRDNFATGTAS